MTDEAERIEAFAGTGIHGRRARNTYKDNGKAAADEIDDRVDTPCRTGCWGSTEKPARGATISKFDPIPTQDYYSLAGVFADTKLNDLPVADRAVIKKYEDGQKRVKDAEEKIKAFAQAEKNGINEKQADDIAKYMEAVKSATLSGADHLAECVESGR